MWIYIDKEAWRNAWIGALKDFGIMLAIAAIPNVILFGLVWWLFR